MDVQGSGRDCWESSSCMDMHESSPLASLAYRSASKKHPNGLRYSHDSLSLRPGPITEFIALETDCNGRGEAPALCRPASPLGYDLSPNQEMLTPIEEPPVEAEFSQVDLNEWHPRYWACLQHFLDQGQHSSSVQSLAAFINIRLPHQRFSAPVTRFPAPQPMDSGAEGTRTTPSLVPLRPYIRRLIVTGNDTPKILQAFFGSDWQAGVGCICKQERVNYLFTAKSGGWASTKAAYDILPDEQAPFLRPLHEATEEELRLAESRWCEWLAMEDWMVGSRSPW
ncbi:hypothetical protein BBP40_007377 [Aspergillus hancockii]|nr:hypothetical protein BBP40_007377 [Aspergillus hancockii]